ncbi:SigE family RNA polymerase sigma factor [Cryptosporangium phraense]|uniref:SigE family RNA polymerase sigma factor n=1 Tax=Cryptosporangium phraense TaxID=2593070 RepID=A0A545ARR7_9ACTN|nr:SigE family RNA polymerase sigma factor [Cryptosporangium phraense]TQS44028.1 SigE family RNA polymerase sigma factor [Cryptosporangium phraense]
MTDEPDQAYRAYIAERLPMLRRLAHLLSQDWHRADDLVQSTMVRLYLRWERVAAATDRDAYARAVLVRVFLSERRTGWARRVVLVDSAVDTTATVDPDAASAVAVRTALAALPARQRAVLVLRYYSDLSVEQTADALGCSAGTVKSHTSRALAALRRALPDDEPASVRPGGER